MKPKINRKPRIKSKLIILIIVLYIFLFSSYLISHQVSAQDSSLPEASLSPVPGSDYKTSEPGEVVSYKLVLKNRGEQRETFIISIESDYNWNVEVTPQTGVSLSPGETEDIIITFHIPASIQDTDYQFAVIVKSRGLPAAETIIHVIGNQDSVIITAALKPVLIIYPEKTHLDKISPGESVEVDVEVKCYVISVEIHLDYELNKVLRSRLSPEKNLTVNVDPESKYINKGGSYYFTITIEFPKSFDKKVNYNCQLRLQAVASGFEAITKPKTLTFILVHEPESNFFETLISSPIAVAGIFTILTVGILGAAIGSTEVGKYRFLLLLFIPLYTKLHKDKILDHFTRGRVYEYIRNNPGVHYSEIKRELDLNNGSLAYHLHTLEREALIKSISSGRFKLFYPTGVKIPKDMEPQISTVRKQILDIIREEPGISQSELGSRFDDKTQRTISYHVKTMSREGVLRLEKVGRENKCYLNDEIMEMSSGETTDAQSVQNMEDDKYLEKDTILRQI